MLSQNARAAKVAIKRMGTPATIVTPTGGATNGYGKKSGETWTTKGTESVTTFYQGASSPTQSRVQGGRYRTDSPNLALYHDSVAAEGDRVYVNGFEYEIDAVTHYPTHKEATTTAVY